MIRPSFFGQDKHRFLVSVVERRRVQSRIKLSQWFNVAAAELFAQVPRHHFEQREVDVLVLLQHFPPFR